VIIGVALLLVGLVSADGEVQTMEGADDVLASADPGQGPLMPMLRMYSETNKEANEARAQSDYLKTEFGGLGEIQATLAGGEGQASATEASKHAKAAVEGVAAAKKAMAEAQAMLTAAEQAAAQSETDAVNSANEDNQDMTKIVMSAVAASQSAESLKMQTLRAQRTDMLAKKDAAFRHAEEDLEKKRNEVLELGDADIQKSEEKMRLIEADGPNAVKEAITNKIQQETSPQKLAVLSSNLLAALGHKDASVSDETIQDLPEKLGDATPSQVTKDEQTFDKVFQEMKDVEKNSDFKSNAGTKKPADSGATQANDNLVSPDKLKQLADAQAHVAKKLQLQHP